MIIKIAVHAWLVGLALQKPKKGDATKKLGYVTTFKNDLLNFIPLRSLDGAPSTRGGAAVVCDVFLFLYHTCPVEEENDFGKTKNKQTKIQHTYLYDLVFGSEKLSSASIE